MGIPELHRRPARKFFHSLHGFGDMNMLQTMIEQKTRPCKLISSSSPLKSAQVRQIKLKTYDPHSFVDQKNDWPIGMIKIWGRRPLSFFFTENDLERCWWVAPFDCKCGGQPLLLRALEPASHFLSWVSDLFPWRNSLGKLAVHKTVTNSNLLL